MKQPDQDCGNDGWQTCLSIPFMALNS